MYKAMWRERNTRRYHSIRVGCGGGGVGGQVTDDVEQEVLSSIDVEAPSFSAISLARSAGFGDGYSSKCVRTSYFRLVFVL